MPTPPFGSPAIDQEFDRIAMHMRQSTAIIRSASYRSGAQAQGAAVVWSADGLLVTNAHVARANRALVDLADERRLPARTVARDPRHDLALLRVDPGALPLLPAALGDPTTLRPGAMVLAFGHPLGVSNALAMGVLHGTKAPLGRHTSRGIPAPLLCADIRLAPGNSGGPLADAGGRVVGVNTLVAGGLGYAVSIERARRLVATLVPRPHLGIVVRAVPVRRRAEAGTASALLVLEVASGGAADRAGILPGDVLFTLDDHPLREPDDLAAALAALADGRDATLAYGRGGRHERRTLAPLHFTGHTRRAA